MTALSQTLPTRSEFQLERIVGISIEWDKLAAFLSNATQRIAKRRNVMVRRLRNGASHNFCDAACKHQNEKAEKVFEHSSCELGG